MSYEKVKTETYTQIGGINNKASTYATPTNDVLNIENLDFSEPGALTKRPGFTSGLAGNTLSLNYRVNNITALSGQYYGIKHFLCTDQSIFSYSWTLAQCASFISVTTTNNNWVAANLTNLQFISSDNHFFKVADYDPFYGATGTFAAKFGLPAPANTPDVTLTGSGSSFVGGVTFAYYIGYFDKFSYQDSDATSPNPGFFIPRSFLGPKAGPFYVVPAAGNVVRFFNLSMSVGDLEYRPYGFALYRDNVGGYDASDIVLVDQKANGAPGSTFLDDNNFYTATGSAPYSPSPQPSDTKPDMGRVLTTDPVSPIEYSQFTEFFKNRLWIVSSNNSDYSFQGVGRNVVLFSEAAEPENFQPESFFIITNKEFSLSGMKAYLQSLFISLYQGIYRVTGDNLENFVVEPITEDYGFVSHKAVVTWKNVMWFLDRRGIVEYNGSSFQIVSDRIEDTIDSINFSAAADRATGAYIKDRNEVWFCVPTGSSDNPDTVLVYDTDINAWTTFKGFSASSLAIIYKGSTPATYISTNSIYFGTPSGTVNYFDSSFKGDNSSAISCVLRTRFLADMGNSVEKQFRRLFLDSGPVSTALVSATQAISINFYADHASSAISATATMYQGASTQSRIDYGVPAKALSVEMIHSSSENPFQIFGYTVESRYQRSV